MAARLVSLLGAAAGVAGHGVLTLPASRNGGSIKTAAAYETGQSGQHSWYTLGSPIPGPATTCGTKYVTAVPCSESPYESRTPWRAPGTADVFSPCGAWTSTIPNARLDANALGPYPRCPAQCGTCCKNVTEYATLHDGRDLPKTKRTVWKAGATAEVGWAALYNHGGGYAYRLCPANDPQTEECFRKTHLDFVGNTSVLRYTDGKEQEISALTLSEGTHPAGSQWRAIRITACAGLGSPTPCPAILPSPAGVGKYNEWHYSVVDKVVIPGTLPTGDYTLSWRWDTEINHQIWQNCADITVEA